LREREAIASGQREVLPAHSFVANMRSPVAGQNLAGRGGVRAARLDDH
jgi:hypothetical protein